VKGIWDLNNGGDINCGLRCYDVIYFDGWQSTFLRNSPTRKMEVVGFSETLANNQPDYRLSSLSEFILGEIYIKGV
jgi:hypothetical protein